jgi:hypothetical protein
VIGLLDLITELSLVDGSRLELDAALLSKGLPRRTSAPPMRNTKTSPSGAAFLHQRAGANTASGSSSMCFLTLSTTTRVRRPLFLPR